MRYHCTVQRPRLLVSSPQSAALPRRIASGVFFVNPDDDDKLNNNGNDALLSSNILVNLGITHAVVPRGSDVRFSWGMKALFVGPQDPLSKIVAWMRAVRRLGAHIIVGDFAAAAGYLVVELGLTPRTAWLRIARGIPPVGDFVLARLCALAVVHNKKEKDNGNEKENDNGSALRTSERERTTWNGDGQTGCGYQGMGISSRSCRRQRFRTRTESGLKHVVVS
jgi:hypothetical protein